MSQQSSGGPTSKIYRPSSPGKTHGHGGEKHDMTKDEMHSRYEKSEMNQKETTLNMSKCRTVDTYGSHSNREEEWFFANKRLLFTAKGSDISN
jgi:hypothetical protein